MWSIQNHTLGWGYATIVLLSVTNKGGAEKGLRCGGIVQSLCKNGQTEGLSTVGNKKLQIGMFLMTNFPEVSTEHLNQYLVN